MNNDQQMAAAILLRQEFNSGSLNPRRGRGRGSSRGGGNFRGRGNGPVSTGPRIDFASIATTRTSDMTWPMPASNSPPSQKVALSTATTNQPQTKINKTLSEWVDGGKSSRPKTTPQIAPSTTAPFVTDPALRHQPSQAWTTKQSTHVTQDSVTTRGSEAVASAPLKPSTIDHQLEDLENQEKTAKDNTARISFCQSMGSSEKTNTINPLGQNIETKQTTANNTSNKVPVLIDFSSEQSTAPYNAKDKAFSAGQASRLLAGLVPVDTKTTATASASPFGTGPEFGTAAWAFDNLSSGLPLPTKEEAVARMDKGKQPELNTINCKGPKRSRPLRDLSASKFNTDVDGDREVPESSSAKLKASARGRGLAASMWAD